MKHFIPKVEFSTRFWLTSIILLAVFLRFYKLDFKSLWLDELYAIVSCHPTNSLKFIIDYCKSDQPPLFFVLLNSWFQIFIYSSFSGRLLSVLIGVLGVFSMFLLGKEIKNERIGLLAAFLTCMNYFHIYFSQELRFYSLLFLMTTLSWLFFVRSLKHKTLLNYSLYILSAIALLYTHYYGIIIFFIQGFVFVIYIILTKQSRGFFFWGFLAGTLVTISYIPWIPTIIADSQIGLYWMEKPKPYFLIGYYSNYMGKDIVTGVLLLLACILYLRYFTLILRNKEKDLFEVFIGLLLISWIFLNYAIPYLRSILATPMMIPRHTITVLPALFLMMAMGLEQIKKTSYKMGVIAVVVVSISVNLFFVKNHYTLWQEKAQWREAAQAVINNNRPGMKVFSNQEWWFSFYFNSTCPRIKPIGKFSFNETTDLQSFIDEIKDQKGFWVLSGEGMQGVTQSQQKVIDSLYRIEEQYGYYAASAILYTKK